MIEYAVGTPIDNANLSQSNIFVNVTASDTNEANITFVLYNATGEVNITVYTNEGRMINWTGLSDGNYVYNVTIVDAVGASNSTDSRTVTLDSVFPQVSVNSPTATTYTTESVSLSVTLNESGVCTYSFDAGVTNTSMTSSDSLTFTKTVNLSNADYIVNYYCEDNAGNENNSANVSFTVEVPASSSSSSSGGSSSAFPKYSPSVYKLSEGYKISLGRGYMVGFESSGEAHVFTVDSILGDSVMITVSSDPVTFEIMEGDARRVDLDRDGYYDLLVVLDNIGSGRADFVLTTINEKVEGAAVEESEDGAEGEPVEVVDGGSLVNEDYGNWGWIWVVLFLIGVVVAVFFARKKF